jgi:prepilin-type N-terminal cleavage/methylation domain-containing protein
MTGIEMSSPNPLNPPCQGDVYSSPDKGRRGGVGFTLIELMVAVGLFSVLLLVGLGVFSRFVAVQRRAVGQQEVQEDIRLALQLFNREARTAYGDTYTTDVGGSGVCFRNQEKKAILYFLKEGVVTRTEAPNFETECSGISVDDTKAITDPLTIVDTLTFRIGSGQQRSITTVIKAHSANGGANSPDASIHVQSTVASRQLRPYTP